MEKQEVSVKEVLEISIRYPIYDIDNAEVNNKIQKLIDNLGNGEVFKKGSITVWKCRNCGHIHVGTEAPAVCPVCKHPQAFFEVNAENY